jgi:ubiquitin
MRDLTTSTGEPHTTAKKPAPSPDSIWQYALSSTMPASSSDCLILRDEQGRVAQQLDDMQKGNKRRCIDCWAGVAAGKQATLPLT